MLHDNGGTAGDMTVAAVESGDGSSHAPKFEGKKVSKYLNLFFYFYPDLLLFNLYSDVKLYVQI